MTIEVERLIATLEANFSKYDRALNKALGNTNSTFTRIEQRGKQLETQLAGIGNTSLDLGKSLIAVFGGAALLGGLSQLPGAIREVVRGLGDLNDMADKIGLPVESLQAFHYGAQLAGIDASSLDDALSKFAKTVGEATAKGNDFSKILTANGIALKDVDGNARPLVDLLRDYANLVKNAATSTDQMFLATTAFGKGGGEMINILRDGADGLDRIQSSARDAGVVLSQDLVHAAADVDDAFDKLSMQLKATFETEVVQGIQTVQSLIDRFEAVPGAIESAWTSFEGFWNRVSGVSPADAATQKLKAAMLQANINGSKPWENGFSVQDLDFGPAAGKGDRLGTPAQPTKIDIATPKKTGGSHGIKKTAEDAFNEDITGIKNRIAALKEEQAALGLTFEEQQKRKVALDLEQQALKDVQEAARKKGDTDWQNAKLSPEQIQQINAVADAYAKQADELRKAQQAQDLQRDVLKGAFDDLRGALDDGKLDWQDLGDVALNALDKIIDKIENDLVDAILQMNSAGGGGGGILGSLLGALGLGGGGSSFVPTPGGFSQMLGIPGYAKGTGNHPGGLAWVGERGRELLNLPAGSQVAPHDLSERLASRSSTPSVISSVFAPTIHMDGGQGDSGDRVTAALKKFEKEFTGRVVKSIREAKTNGLMS